MNPWQLAQNLKHRLQTVAWPTGSAEVVFGTRGVRIFAGAPTEEQIPAGFPWVLIGIGSASPDETHPELLTQTFDLITAVDVKGDPMGEHAIIGGSAADLGKSVGRGIAEVTERVQSVVGNLTGADGAPIQVTASSLDAPNVFGRGRHLAISSHTLTALCTRALSYEAPQEIAVTSSSWTWQGGHCSSRFDFLQYRLVEKTGYEPSTSPSDGTVRYTGTTAAATYAPAAGKTYTVFADYSSRGQTGVIEGSSDPEVGSYLVIE